MAGNKKIVVIIFKRINMLNNTCICCHEKQSTFNSNRLYGNPLRVMGFLSSHIENHHERITRKIQLSEINQSLQITRDSARSAIKFLNKNNFINRIDYYPGVDGWTRYQIPAMVFEERCNHQSNNIKKAISKYIYESEKNLIELKKSILGEK